MSDRQDFLDSISPYRLRRYKELLIGWYIHGSFNNADAAELMYDFATAAKQYWKPFDNRRLLYRGLSIPSTSELFTYQVGDSVNMQPTKAVASWTSDQTVAKEMAYNNAMLVGHEKLLVVKARNLPIIIPAYRYWPSWLVRLFPELEDSEVIDTEWIVDNSQIEATIVEIINT